MHIPYFLFLYLLDLQTEGRELGVDALVENEHDGVVLLDGAAEHGLEQAVRAHGLRDVAAQAPLGHQLRGLEPAHVLRVVEQMPHHSEFLAHTDRETCQNYLYLYEKSDMITYMDDKDKLMDLKANVWLNIVPSSA